MQWDTLINIFAVFFIAISFITLLNIDHWIVRTFDFPRLQITTLLVLVTVLKAAMTDGLAFWDLLIFIGLTAAIIYQLWWILPYSPLVPKEVKTAEENTNTFRIKILSTNVLMTNRDYQPLLNLVRDKDPDLVVTLETDKWWESKLSSLETEYPYTVFCPLDNLYGMHLYSKYPLHNAEVKYLVEDDKPSIHAAIDLPDQRQARLHFLHPAPPSPTENDESSERDAELLVMAETLKEVDEPVIVAGDLNDVAWSRTTKSFRKISGLLDPRIGRGTFNTFHTKYWFLRWPLDHLFHSHHFTLRAIERLSNIGSDHFPLMSQLEYTPEVKQQSNEIDTPEDEAWAKEKISQEPVSAGDVPDPTRQPG